MEVTSVKTKPGEPAKQMWEMELVERILNGEKAILAEYEHLKKIEDRNRLLRFNQPQTLAVNDIEMSSK